MENLSNLGGPLFAAVVVIVFVFFCGGLAQRHFHRGVEYYKGTGSTPKNHAMAVEYFKKAANAGSVEGAYMAGLCYMTGTGVGKDQGMALVWFRKAADKKFGPAEFAVAKCHMSPVDGKPDFDEALKYIERSASHGFAPAETMLGVFMCEGLLGLNKDMTKGCSLLRSASAKGDDEAKAHLGYYLVIGDGVKRDEAEGLELVRKSAENGDAAGEYRLACLYLDGKGVKKDVAEGERLLELSASKGNSSAAQLLANLRAMNGSDKEGVR